MRVRNNMRVLGIDPGYDRLGLAVLEGDPSRPAVVWSTCITPPKGTQSERLNEVYQAVSSAILQHHPDKLSLETLFFSTNKKTAIAVAESRGAILAAAGAQGVAISEYSPAQVKLAVTGHGGADKQAIARMVPHLVSLDARKRLDDELDAIAVAIAGLSDRSA
jgi:crossover junction endodeoxyribonuclease RuvC